MSGDKLIKVFVYGTLLTGMGNWEYLLSPREGIPDQIYGFVMYSLGGFPGIIPDSDKGINLIEGEVFEITEEDLKRFDRLEGYSGKDSPYNMYVRKVVKTVSGEEVFTYIYNDPDHLRGRALIPDGDWRKFVEGKLK